jgi:hypothetical protein
MIVIGNRALLHKIQIYMRARYKNRYNLEKKLFFIYSLENK